MWSVAAAQTKPEKRTDAIRRPALTLRGFTVAEVAASYRVKPHTVLSWIKAGWLQAANMAAASSTRPRWRISEKALEAFEDRRSSPSPQSETVPAKKKKNADGGMYDPKTGKLREEFKVVG
jgi:hypothetical protein